MNISSKEFIREYLKSILDGHAAVFAGAGLSRGSGYVDWKGLLKDLAEDISLDVSKESDLVAVAQYYRNERGGRASLNQAIINQFTKAAKPNENIRILARLPIETYWTTNYDHLIETELRNLQKNVDVKLNQTNLATTLPERDAVVYKMHGDISDPANAVLTKDDFEAYNISRRLFTTSLQGDLVSKTFIFIGFSFEDPNLSYILSRIRGLLLENQRTHYCFFKKVSDKDYEDNSDFQYAAIKQELQIKDLQRYSINAVLIDDYSEITDILKEIERRYSLGNVFVSGSAAEYGDWKDAVTFMSRLAQQLIRSDYRIVSGLGNGVGAFIISGALKEIMENKSMKIEKFLSMRPSPFIGDVTGENQTLKDTYHASMIKSAGAVIFLFGNKLIDEKYVESSGVLEEYTMATQQGKYIIPVGSTGYASKKIADLVKSNLEQFSYLKNHIEKLCTERDHDTLIKCIIDILSEIKNLPKK